MYNTISSIDMIRTLITFLFASALQFSYAQNFEGVIIYKTSYESKIPTMTSDQLAQMMGTRMEYTVKDGSYKTSTDGTFFQWQIYVTRDNKLYNKLASSETLFWNDGAINNDEFVKAEINRNVIEILGYRCDELIITCKNSVQKHYFNSTLAMNPKLFEHLKYGSWNEVISRTKAVPLKMIVDLPQYKLECIATDVKPMKIENSLFELPVGSKTEKSPF